MPSPIHKRFKKPKPKGLRRRMKRLSPKPRELPKLQEQKKKDKPFDIIDEKERAVTRTLGSDTMAKRVLALQEEYPRGTLPELTAMDWLNSRHHQYFYQVEVLGGRRAGGLVPDFVLPKMGGALALLVQGTYWHEGFENEARTETAKLRIKGQVVFGHKIEDVVEVWDTRLYADRNRVMEAAVRGIGMGR